MNIIESQKALDFDESIDHNLDWIKQLATQHDVSQGLVANAALMTMTMMDHHRFNLVLAEIKSDLEVIRQQLCLLNSSLIIPKESLLIAEPTSTECSTLPLTTATSLKQEKSNPSGSN